MTELKPKLFIHCKGCEQLVEASEYNGDTDECNECHDSGSAGDGCRCERCHDQLVSAADFYEVDYE